MHAMVATLELAVPDFVSLSQDLDDRKAMLSVENSDMKHQREMWGAFSSRCTLHVAGIR